jgi:hypothetical protein
MPDLHFRTALDLAAAIRGTQIVAPYLEDRTSIDFARRLVDVSGGFEPPPGF